VAFQTSMDALRFCHAVQMVLMQVAWPPGASDYFGSAVPSPDGRWLFHGPRVCTAIHESTEYFVSVWRCVCVCVVCLPVLAHVPASG
jgi:hypothetical protein